MCGRFTLRTPSTQLAQQFRLPSVPDLPPRYNIAPTQPVAAVRAPGGQRELVMLHWGLIPSWADSPRVGNRSINARAETADRRPMFRSAFRQRRCLVLADGFYEWKPTGKQKQPYYIHAADGRPFAFAGLWERWRGAEEPIESCTILTTDANRRLASLHDRMPVILAPDDYDLWLDSAVQEAERLKPLLAPYPDDELQMHAVSTDVNRPKNDSPECIEPIEVQTSLPGF
jgi:putative SOS response-associated peptidase YedK